MDKNIRYFNSGQSRYFVKLKSSIFNCITLRLMRLVFRLRKRIENKNDMISGLHTIILNLHHKIKELENDL